MSRLRKRNVIVYCVASLVFLAGVSAAAAGDSCAAAELSDLNTSLRVAGHPAVARQCFATALPAQGWLLLEAVVPNAAAVEPRLELLGRVCDSAVASDRPYRFHMRSASSVLLEISEAGSYQFCVVPQDPEQRLGDYVVVNRFTAFGKDHEEEHEPEPDPLADADGCSRGARIEPIAAGKDHEEEHEPEPDPLVAPGVCACQHSLAAGLGKDHEEEHEPEPDPFTLDPCDPRLRQICGRSKTDDHADTLSCATLTRLGVTAAAELDNDWQDDGDLFAFYVEEAATVRVESTGDSDTVGGLYDHHGYRLRVDGDSGYGANFRIVKTLAPGWYFARVDGGEGAAGAYELSVEVVGLEE